MKRKPYPSDLTDEQWDVLACLLPSAKTGGRPRTVDLREVVNGIVYVLRNGCTWRAMPHDLPPWGTVWWYFRGMGDRMVHGNESMRPCGPKFGRPKAATQTPSAAIIDSQSVKTTEKRGPRGYDAGKKVNGRKRHIIVDTMGLLLAVVVHPANIQDRDGAKLVIDKLIGRFPRMRLVWADAGYAGKLIEWVWALTGWGARDCQAPQGQPPLSGAAAKMGG